MMSQPKIGFQPHRSRVRRYRNRHGPSRVSSE